MSQSQARGVVTDFKAADTNNDAKLTQAEFTAACDKGLVTASAGTDGSGWPWNDRQRARFAEKVRRASNAGSKRGRAQRVPFCQTDARVFSDSLGRPSTSSGSRERADGNHVSRSRRRAGSIQERELLQE